jgi:hypothetical protein
VASPGARDARLHDLRPVIHAPPGGYHRAHAAQSGVLLFPPLHAVEEATGLLDTCLMLPGRRRVHTGPERLGADGVQPVAARNPPSPPRRDARERTFATATPATIRALQACADGQEQARYDRKLWIVEPVTPAACLPA